MLIHDRIVEATGIPSSDIRKVVILVNWDAWYVYTYNWRCIMITGQEMYAKTERQVR